MSYQFQLEKKSAIAFGVGAILLAVTLFVAGILTEMLLARRSLPVDAFRSRPLKNQTTPASPVKPASLVKQDGSQALPAASVAPPSAPAQTSAIAAAGVAAVPAVSPVASSSSFQLAVQVGTFDDPTQAKHLAEQLQKEGFTPRISPQLGVRNQELNVVEIGPFSSWEQASQVAQLIGQSLGTRPAIRPML